MKTKILQEIIYKQFRNITLNNTEQLLTEAIVEWKDYGNKISQTNNK